MLCRDGQKSVKKIFVFKGQSAYQVLRRAADEVCKGFEACGYEVDMVDVEEEYATEHFISCLEHRAEYEFYFSIQAIGWEKECGQLPQLAEMKRIGWIVDDPVYHSGRLIGSLGKNAYVLMVRDEHANTVRRQYPKFESVETLYHGGFEGDFKIPYNEKGIEVFFPGTYVPLSKSGQRVREIEGVFGTIADQAKTLIIGEYFAKDWRMGLRKYLEMIDFEISDEDFEVMCQIMGPLDQYQRDYMRQTIIENLLVAGIKISVVGAGWRDYEGAGKENLLVLSDNGMDISEVVKLMQRSKIVLNNTNIMDGMHERIFTAMLQGAVCITNEFELLHDFFEDGKELITFSLNQLNELPEIVKNLQQNPDKAEQIAENGYQAVKEKHTWRHRGEQVIKWVEDGEKFEY